MLSSTVDRVPVHSPQSANCQIEQSLRSQVNHYAGATTEEITARLHSLEQEWDVERIIEAQAATATLVGLTLGVSVDRRWLALPAFVAGFLLQHAVQGWCPPLEVLRRLGFRTSYEIDQERYALKALRGDFQEMHRMPADPQHMGERALEAVKK